MHKAGETWNFGGEKVRLQRAEAEQLEHLRKNDPTKYKELGVENGFGDELTRTMAAPDGVIGEEGAQKMFTRTLGERLKAEA